jgi:hypothetical protein
MYLSTYLPIYPVYLSVYLSNMSVSTYVPIPSPLLYINTCACTQSGTRSCLLDLRALPRRRTYSSEMRLDCKSYRRWQITDPDGKWQFPRNRLRGPDGFFAVRHPATRNRLPSNNRFCCQGNAVRDSSVCAMCLGQSFFANVSPAVIWVGAFCTPCLQCREGYSNICLSIYREIWRFRSLQITRSLLISRKLYSYNYFETRSMWNFKFT